MTGFGLFDEDQEIAQTAEKFLTFLIDGQYFAIPIEDVREIIATQSVTQMPDFPEYVKGVINLRGSIIPLVDLRLRFRKPEKERDEYTSIVITSIEGTDVGFVVDAVDEVLDIDKEHLASPPKMGEGSARYLKGIGRVGEKIVLLLDVGALLSGEEIAGIAEVTETLVSQPD